MITGPGFLAGGQVRALFSAVDVAPTLIDAAGIEVPAQMAGRSILPVIRDYRAPWRDDVFFQISETETGRALRTHRWKYGVTSTYDENRPRSEVYREAYLYDLDNDPYEMINLIGLTPFRKVADDLKARLLRWIAEVEDGQCPEIQDAKSRFPRQYRLRPSDLLEAADLDRDIDPLE
jgi:arylsulfatase A-like enzyme